MPARRIGDVLSALVLAAFAAACSSDHIPAAESGPLVTGIKVETVRLEALPELYAAVGTVRSVSTAVLTAQLAGAVREVHVNAGEHVKRGQLLVVLDDRTPRAQVQAAEAGISEAAQGLAEVEQSLQAAAADRQFAENTYKRYKALLDKNSLSRQEFEGAEARYKAALANEHALEAKKLQIEARQSEARSQQDSAQTYFSYARVVAPFDGIVSAKSVDAGSVVMPGTPLVTVEDSTRYRLEASLPEEYMSRVQAGEAVAVQVESGDFHGRVAEIVPAADSASRTFLVKVDLPSNCHCRTGEYGTANFPIGEARRLAVPSAAVVERGELQGVFVVAPDGRVEYRLVKTGKALGNRLEILSGLAEGERLATNGTERLRDGARVEAL